MEKFKKGHFEQCVGKVPRRSSYGIDVKENVSALSVEPPVEGIPQPAEPGEHPRGGATHHL